MKLFQRSSKNLVCSQNLLNEKNSLEEIYIANIYYDSGVHKSVFLKLYLETMKCFFKNIKCDKSQLKILEEISVAMRKRRGLYLPVGVLAEDVHYQKDAWSFTVFAAGLIINANKSAEEVISSVFDPEVTAWLNKKNGAIESLFSICNENSLDANVSVIRKFYEMPILNLQSSTLNIITADENKEPKITNKELGGTCIKWLKSKASDNDFFECYFIDNDLFVQTPKAFIIYAKETGQNWKGIQKGVIKQNMHEIDEQNSPFHKKDGVNVMVFRELK